MTPRLAGKCSFGRKLLLTAAIVVVVADVAGPIVRGQGNLTQSQTKTPQTSAARLLAFEVAAIKLNHSGDNRDGFGTRNGRFTATGQTARGLIEMAYKLKDSQLSGGPSWINSERYDIDAKIDDSDFESFRKLPPYQRMDQVALMVQSLLADRFNLEVSHQKKGIPVFVLVVAKNGSKLVETKIPQSGPPGFNPQISIAESNGDVTATNVHLSALADLLSSEQEVGRVVVDETGLRGSYDFELHWQPEALTSNAIQKPDNGSPSSASGPSIFTALQGQLGLRLESAKRMIDSIEIERIERPSEN